MALTVANQLTTITECDAKDDAPGVWTGTDATIDVDTDIYYEPLGSIGWDTDIEIYNATYTLDSTIDLSSTVVYFWFLSMTASYLDTWENGGIGMRLEDSSGNWSEWWLGGSDTYAGGWRRFCLSTSSSPDDESASSPTLSVTKKVIIRTKAVTKSKLTDNTFVDYIQHGTGGIKVTGGSVPSPGDWSEVLSGDESVYAGLIREVGGVYYLLGPVQFGDDTSGDVYFSDSNQIVVTEDLYRTFTATSNRSTAESLVDSTHFSASVLANAGGTTNFQLGDKSGSQGIQGCVLKSGGDRKLILTATDADIDELKLYGCTFLDLGTVSLPVTAAGREVLSCNFGDCAEVLPSTCVVKYCKFVNADDRGCRISTTSFNVTDCDFIACGHGVHFPNTGTYAFTALKFSGNTYDIENSSGGLVTINADANSDPGSYEITVSGGSVTIVNTKTLTITCKNSSGNVVEGVKVRIEKDPSGDLISEGTTNSSGVYTDASYNYTGDQDVKIIARLKGYNFNAASDTIKTTGLSVPLTMIADKTVDLP